MPARHGRYFMDRHCVDDLLRSKREAWRVAGLQHPGEEAKSCM